MREAIRKTRSADACGRFRLGLFTRVWLTTIVLAAVKIVDAGHAFGNRAAPGSETAVWKLPDGDPQSGKRPAAASANRQLTRPTRCGCSMGFSGLPKSRRPLFNMVDESWLAQQAQNGPLDGAARVHATSPSGSSGAMLPRRIYGARR